MRDGEKTQIVVAGGHGSIGSDQVVLNSVEICDPIDNAWHIGNCFKFRMYHLLVHKGS